MTRLRNLLGQDDSERASTHLLHLAPEGRIDAHVDNISASGRMIVGVSLGAERVMRLEKQGAGFDVLLPSGSVYFQQCVTAVTTRLVRLITEETFDMSMRIPS